MELNFGFLWSARGIIALSISVIIIATMLARPFWGLLFYLFLLIVQPHQMEMFPGLETLPIAKFFIFFLILSIFFHPDIWKGIKRAFCLQTVLLILFSFALIFSGYTLAESYQNFNLLFLPLFGLYLLILIVIKDEKQLKTYIYALVALTTYLAIYGIIQHSIPGGNVEYDDGIDRIMYYGTFSDPNDLAIPLVCSVPFILNLLASARKIVFKVIYAGVFLLHLWAIYFTYSRSGFLGLGVVLLLMAFKSKRKIIAGILALAILSGILYCNPELRWRLSPLRQREIAELDPSAKLRIEAWKAGINMVKINPLRGVGIGKFTENILNYAEDTSLLRRNITAHNSFILVAAEAGVFGFVLYVLIFLKTLWDLFIIARLHKKFKEVNYLSSWGDSLFASIAGFMVTAMFLSRAYNFLPFIFIALAVCLKKICFEQIKNVN